jgi:hypothetical protein
MYTAVIQGAARLRDGKPVRRGGGRIRRLQDEWIVGASRAFGPASRRALEASWVRKRGDRRRSGTGELKSAADRNFAAANRLKPA